MRRLNKKKDRDRSIFFLIKKFHISFVFFGVGMEEIEKDQEFIIKKQKINEITVLTVFDALLALRDEFVVGANV